MGSDTPSQALLEAFPVVLPKDQARLAASLRTAWTDACATSTTSFDPVSLAWGSSVEVPLPGSEPVVAACQGIRASGERGNIDRWVDGVLDTLGKRFVQSTGVPLGMVLRMKAPHRMQGYVVRVGMALPSARNGVLMVGDLFTPSQLVWDALEWEKQWDSQPLVKQLLPTALDTPYLAPRWHELIRPLKAQHLEESWGASSVAPAKRPRV